MNYSVPSKIAITTALLILAFCALLKAQTVFEKSYGTITRDVANYLDLTTDGGYIVIGETGDLGLEDIYLVKLDAEGTVQWSRIFSLNSSEQGFSVKQTTDSGYILTGYILDTVFVNRMFLIKTDNSGNIEWSKVYSSSDKEEGVEVQQTADGGYFISGYQYNEFYFNYDPLVMRTDESGNVLWCKVYPTHNSEWGDMHLERTSSGDYYLTSIQVDLSTIPLNENIYLLKIDSDGNALSGKIYGDSLKDERGFAIRELPSGNFQVAGSVNLKAMVLQVDPSGNIVWAKKYENGYDEMEVWAFDYKPEAGSAICGLENILPSKEDAFIFKIDEDGNAGWGKVYGKRNTYYWEEAHNIKITPDYGLIVSGGSYVYGQSEWDMYIAKTDLNGNTGCDSTTAITTTNVTVPVKSFSVYDSTIVMNATDGNFLVSEECAVSIQCAGPNAATIIEPAAFRVYPNPVHDAIYFSSNAGMKIKEWKLFNLPGQLIADQKSGSTTLDVSTIPAGTYFYEITIAENSRIIHSMIVISR